MDLQGKGPARPDENSGNKKKILKILYTNADTLHNKIQELKLLLETLESTPQIIAITEIKAKKRIDIYLSEFNIPGYTVYSNNLEENNRGILIYVDTKLQSCIQSFNIIFDEYLSITIKGNNINNLTILTVYRSPNSNCENDSHLKNLLDTLYSSTKENIITIGDFNLSEINWNDYTSNTNSYASNQLLKAIRDNLLIQHIDKPTRARGLDTPHILDLVLTNNQFITEITYHPPLGLSDHMVIEIHCDFETTPTIVKNRLNYSKGDYTNFKSFLNIDWSDTLKPQTNNIETMWKLFKDKLKEGVNKFIPFANNFNSWKHSKWKRPLKLEIRNLITEKRKLFKNYIKTRNPSIILKYKRISNLVREETRKLQKSEELNIAKECKQNPKKFWNYVNSKFKSINKIGNLKYINEFGQEEITNDEKTKCNILNDLFASVYIKEDNNNFNKLCNIDNQISMDQLVITYEDILQKLSQINVNKSAGPDGLHPKILYEMRNEIALPLKIIYEHSINNQEVPSDWKTANISPKYKKGSKLDASNYRPISITCIICKLLESIIRDHIVKYFTINKLFNINQYGFIKGKSTVLQLLKILEDWSEKLEIGGQIDVIYTDFEKAFDRVPHNRLISKLHSYNIDQNVINWIKAFLCGRKQYVKLNDQYSNASNVISGIPQGSILGPLLFIIYINELPEICTSNLYLYADDAKLYKHILNPLDRTTIQEDLNKINLWTENWLISLNIDKCKKVSYGREIVNDYNYYINNVELENFKAIEDLGVTYNSDLKFKTHINEKINKAYSVLGIIKRNFKFLEKDTFLLIYKSLVRSHLEYANCIWSPHLVSDIKNIEKVQMRATKLVSNIKHLPYIERLKYLSLPTLRYRRSRGDMILVFKILTGIIEPNIACSLSKVSNSITRGNYLKLHQSHVHYDLNKYCFNNRVVSIWNSLPNYVVLACSVKSFENKLDSFWINQPSLWDYNYGITGTGNRS